MSALASTRRGALGAILAAPLASVPAVALTANVDSDAPERADHRARLLAAYAEYQAARPIIGGAAYRSLEDRAATLVQNRVWEITREIMALPPPTTLDGLGVAALASAIYWEGEDPDDSGTEVTIGLIRAGLATTRTVLPLGFIGFGDEPGCLERDRANCEGVGVLPAWAVAQARAEMEACL